MGDKTGIEWTEATWNPLTGCDRISPGCDHCYALTMSARLQHHPAYEGVVENTLDDGLDWSGRINLVPERLEQPLKWKRPRRIFVNSMSDLFHTDVPREFVEQVFDVMRRAHWHTFQVLTKRPQRMAYLLNDRRATPDEVDEGFELGEVPGIMYDSIPPNIWLGTSIESDKYAFRANHLRRTPAAVRFLSLEPLLGPLPSLDLAGIDWVIVGGESGPGARPMHPKWARDLRDRCVEAGVAFHFKQWGSWCPREDLALSTAIARNGGTPEDGVHFKQGMTIVEPEWACGLAYEGNVVAENVGKHGAGRLLDGRTWDEYPVAALPAYTLDA